MDTIRELYQQVIVDHNNNPRNFHTMQNPTCQAEGYNPLCGDQLVVYISLLEGVIHDISFQGHGCAISMASASLMTEFLKGKTEQQVRELFELFHAALTEQGTIDIKRLGKLAVLMGVKDFPSRIKCATLAWHAIKAAINHFNQSLSME